MQVSPLQHLSSVVLVTDTQTDHAACDICSISVLCACDAASW